MSFPEIIQEQCRWCKGTGQSPTYGHNYRCEDCDPFDGIGMVEKCEECMEYPQYCVCECDKCKLTRDNCECDEHDDE